MTATLDFYDIPIEIGDTISFPASGTMMNGKVIAKTHNRVEVINESGNKATKWSRDIINRSALMNAYKQIYPENCI